MSRRSSRAGGRLVVWVVLLSGPLGGAAQPVTTDAPIPVPQPSLDGLEPAVAEQLAAARRAFEAQPETTDSVQRADAFGALGRLYHAYQLVAAAAACYENAVRLVPEDFQWSHLLGRAYEQAGRVDDAITRYEAVRRLRPAYRAAAVRLGMLYLQTNRPELARAQFEAALSSPGTAAAARAGLGEVALSGRAYEVAADHFEAALALAPSATRLHYQLAMAYRGQGDLQAARRHIGLQGGAGVRPEDPLVDDLEALLRGERVHGLRGRLAFGAGDVAGAESAFRAAVSAAPDSAGARVNLAAALAAGGRVQEAIDELRKALDADPAHATAHVNLGLLLSGRGEAGAALPHLRAAVDATPDDAEAGRAYAGTLLSLGRAAEAEPVLRDLVARHADDEAGAVGLADALTRLAKYREAVAVLERAHEQFPDRERTANALARSLAASPDPSVRDGERALQMAQMLFARRPVVAFGETVAMALAELGRCVDAATRQRSLVDAAASAPDVARGLRRDLARYEAGPPCRPPLGGRDEP